MSVGECLSPMSIDKSLLNESNALDSSMSKCERDLFFEVKEYQADILEYLKEAEVLHFRNIHSNLIQLIIKKIIQLIIPIIY